MITYRIRNEQNLAVGDGRTYIHASDGRQFPADEQNPDYQQYLAWLQEGNTPEEWNPDAAE